MNNTIYYAAELMVYFEKHHFLDIITALLIRLDIDRPLCLKHYVKKNLRKIANSLLTRNTIIHLPPGADVGEFANSMLKLNNSPLIIYNKEANNTDKIKHKETLLKFEKFCQNHGIRNKVFLNFPENLEEVLQIQKCNITPTIFFNITVDVQSEEIDFKEVLDYYRNIVTKISTTHCDDTTNLAAEILYKIKYQPISVLHGIGRNFVYRVVFIGRRGSGRQTQAKLLASRYNSVYVNVESLIEQTLQSKDNMAKVLSIAFEKQNYFSSSAVTALVWKRLMQPDTLYRGWVVVNFPKSIKELEILVKKFQTPPNRFVILHCSKSIALKRLVKQWETSNVEIKARNTISYVEKEFTQYDQNIKSMYSYLKSTKMKTIHVEGKGSSAAIKNKIFALLER